jgi:hypothetical protein
VNFRDSGAPMRRPNRESPGAARTRVRSDKRGAVHPG